MDHGAERNPLAHYQVFEYQAILNDQLANYNKFLELELTPEPIEQVTTSGKVPISGESIAQKKGINRLQYILLFLNLILFCNTETTN
jgi:hypothetical protein